MSQEIVTRADTRTIVHDLALGIVGGAVIGFAISLFSARWTDSSIFQPIGAFVGATVASYALFRSHRGGEKFLNRTVWAVWVLLVLAVGWIVLLLVALANFT